MQSRLLAVAVSSASVGAMCASTVNLSPASAGPSPSVVGYGIAHYYPGSNTQSWWKYSAANGARIWSSPSDVEATDDLTPWGDNVTTQAQFISRRTALRANPLSSTYIDWTDFNNKFANQTTSGNNIMKLQYAAQSLTSLNNKLLVVMQRRVGSWDWPATPTSNSSTDWKNRWEAWQHWYAQAFYYAKNSGTERFQMYNEPDHSSAAPLTQAQWIEQMQFAANAIESAIADVNALYGKSLTPRLHGGVTAGGPDLDPGEWGDAAVANLHRPLFSTADVPGYDLWKTFDYHQYTSTSSTFGDTLAATAGTLNTRTGNVANYPISVSEFNVYTNADWPSTLTADSPDVYQDLGGMLVRGANANTLGAAKELYLFKFGLTGNKNATHYVDDTTSPYNVGGVTKSGQVYRLFAKGFAAKDQMVAPASTNGALRMAASHSSSGKMRYLLSSNSSASSSQLLTMDLSSWDVQPGTQIIVEQVGERYHGDVSEIVTVPANRQITVRQDAYSSILVNAPTGVVNQTALTATDDAMVIAGTNASSNFGSNAVINVQNNASTASSRSAAFLKFDLGSISPSLIRTAVLKVTGVNPDSADETIIGHLYGLTNDAWGEGTITFNNAPNLGAAMGNDGSGTVNEIRDNFVEDITNTADIIGNLTASGTEGAMMVDVTAFLKSQPDRLATMMLTRDVRFDGDVDPLTRFVQIRSKEYAGGAFAPQLLLQLSPAEAQWALNGNGNWHSLMNWTGGIPDSVDAAATFGGAITAPRQVTLDTPVVAGTIIFSNSSAYTIAGSSTITLHASSASASILASLGSHVIDVPLNLISDTSLTAAAGATLTISRLQPCSVNVSKNGAGTVRVNALVASSASVNAGRLAITPSGGNTGTSKVEALTIASGASFDLTDNAMILDYTGVSPIDTIRGYLQSGVLFSSLAGSSPSTTLAYRENTMGLASFAGQGIDSTSLLVSMQMAGDVNCDARVNSIDFNILSSNFGAAALDWQQGDFNYDAVVNSADFNAFSGNYGYISGAPLTPLGAIVPEPASLAAIAAWGACLGRRTRHR